MRGGRETCAHFDTCLQACPKFMAFIMQTVRIPNCTNEAAAICLIFTEACSLSLHFGFFLHHISNSETASFMHIPFCRRRVLWWPYQLCLQVRLATARLSEVCNGWDSKHKPEKVGPLPKRAWPN